MATKNGIHYLDPRLLRAAVKVVVIGAGGSGSHVAANLAVLHQSMIDLGHPGGLEVTLIDDDEVSPANVGRARFFHADIGQSKAFVLANRINACHGQAFRAIKARVDARAGDARVLSDADIVIGCVDTRSSRRAIHKALSSRKAGRAYWMDLGNGAFDGQVILGQVGEGDGLLPSVTTLFPEMLDAKSDPKDEGPSCSRAEALTKQSAFVNANAALHAVSMLSLLFFDAQIDHCGVFFNLRSGRVSTIPCSPEVWERIASPPVAVRAVRAARREKSVSLPKRASRNFCFYGVTMRRATHHTDWLMTSGGAIVGLSLGFDFCAEHEHGVGPLLSAFGVRLPSFPLGVKDRMATVVPDRLRLREYQAKPRDRRRRGIPAALLAMRQSWVNFEDQPEKVASAFDAQFYGDFGEKHSRDLAAAWDSSGFCIHVRGERNIAQLQELHSAMLSLDVAVAMPWSHGFLRGGLSFTIPSRMTEEEHGIVLAKDEDYRALFEATEATGIEAYLKAKGKRWFALSPAWLDNKKSEVIFFLNPFDQKNDNFGWFDIEELRDWATARGPVPKDEALIKFAKLPENYDWSCRLLRGMNANGLNQRTSPHLVWADSERRTPGLKLRMSVDSQEKLPNGVYPFAKLMSQFAVVLEERAEVTE